MVDGFRGRAKDLDGFASAVNQCRSPYELVGKYNHSKETDEYPFWVDVENIRLKLTPQQGSITNSLHRFWNTTHGNGEHNYNDFSFCNIQSALDTLEEEIHYSLEDITLTHLEFGFNIEVEKDPTKLLEENILMYKFKPPCINPQNFKKRKIKKFEFEEYIFKIYNKSLQFGLKNKHILRVEIKYRFNQTLRKFGICTLADLRKKEVYEHLMKDFIEKFDNLLIVDYFDNVEGMSETERNAWIRYTHPNYWIDLRNEEKHTNKRGLVYREKLKCKSLIKKYHLNTLQKTIESLLCAKFLELYDYNCNCSTISIGLSDEQFDIAA